MNQRLSELRKTLNLSMEKFGSRIGITRSAISKMESGSSGLSEQTILSICREFNVSEEWLRNGSGEMFVSSTPFERAYNRFGYIMENSSPRKIATLTALLELVYAVPDDKWEEIAKQYDEAMRELKKED